MKTLLYCGSWIIDINSIIAINDLTAESETYRKWSQILKKEDYYKEKK